MEKYVAYRGTYEKTNRQIKEILKALDHDFRYYIPSVCDHWRSK